MALPSGEKPTPPTASTIDPIEPTVQVNEAAVDSKDATTKSGEDGAKAEEKKDEAKASMKNYIVRMQPGLLAPI